MAHTPTTAILTRPAGRNTFVMNGLLRRGWCVKECPALEIREVLTDAIEVPRPESFDLIVFVSRAAVTGYQSQLSQDDTFVWPPSTLTACMGPVTAASIRRAFGESLSVLHPEAERAQDSEALWPLLVALKQPLEKVLIVRGQDGREWLSQRLQLLGSSVTLYQAYTRQVALWPQALSEHFLALQQAGALPSWLLTSSHGVEAVFKNLQKLGLTDWFTRSSFVLTHERLRPLLEKLLGQSIANERVVVVSPEDEVILKGFEQLSHRNITSP
ncbi:MAG: uroporphyrinogen-III synthase [Burkholderiaceae bacterium]|nr:uroporphyrinogen-III synthase [Burkholderiaceae bacterium]